MPKRGATNCVTWPLIFDVEKPRGGLKGKQRRRWERDGAGRDAAFGAGARRGEAVPFGERRTAQPCQLQIHKTKAVCG
jgi:hypothetical protein